MNHRWGQFFMTQWGQFRMAFDTQPHHHMKNDNPAAGSAAAIAPRTGRDAQAAWLRGHLRRAGERGPTRMGREPPKPRLLTLITSPPCRAQRSLMAGDRVKGTADTLDHFNARPNLSRAMENCPLGVTRNCPLL